MTVINVGMNAFSGFGEPQPGDMPVYPNLATAELTSPADGATVEPTFDLAGRGDPGVEVTLWYQFIDPPGPAQSTGMVKTINGSGVFAYIGDTPSSLGIVEWWVVTYRGQSDRIRVTVEDTVDEPDPEPEPEPEPEA